MNETNIRKFAGLMRELGLTVAAEAQDYTIAGVINAIMAREYRD